MRKKEIIAPAIIRGNTVKDYSLRDRRLQGFIMRSLPHEVLGYLCG